MLPQNKPDRIRILFDDHRLVANAGLLLPATLARHLGLRELVDHHLDLGGAPGRANTGDKMLTLVASALAGGDCIDDADALRAGGTVGVLGCVVKAPSTLGTFLRSFRWGGAGALRRGQGTTHGAGRQRLLRPHCRCRLPVASSFVVQSTLVSSVLPGRVTVNCRLPSDSSADASAIEKPATSLSSTSTVATLAHPKFSKKVPVPKISYECALDPYNSGSGAVDPVSWTE